MSDSESKENEEKIEVEETEEVLSVDYDTDKNGPVNTDYEDNDLDLNVVKKFIVVSFAVTIGFFVLMLVVLKFYKNGFEEERGVATEETRQIPGRDDALLQTMPLVDLKEYNDLEEKRMTMTTNAVEHAVIPVDAAKKLMIQENAFPTATAKAETAPSAEPMIAKSEEVSPSRMSMAESNAPMANTDGPVKAVASEPAPDPAMVAAGEKIFTTQCMTCHSGKKGAIGPNIQKAFGTMRKLENHEPILMDEAYVLNSINNPMDHIAKGYMPVMMSFKAILTPEQENQVVAYLKSMGKPIPKAEPKVSETPKSEASVQKEEVIPDAKPSGQTVAPTLQSQDPVMKPEAPKAQEKPAPKATEEPVKPAEEPEVEENPSGIIFV